MRAPALMRAPAVRLSQEGIDPEDLGDLYKEVHSAIRADPVKPKKERKAPKEAKARPLPSP